LSYTRERCSQRLYSMG